MSSQTTLMSLCDDVLDQIILLCETSTKASFALQCKRLAALSGRVFFRDLEVSTKDIDEFMEVLEKVEGRSNMVRSLSISGMCSRSTLKLLASTANLVQLIIPTWIGELAEFPHQLHLPCLRGLAFTTSFGIYRRFPDGVLESFLNRHQTITRLKLGWSMDFTSQVTLPRLAVARLASSNLLQHLESATLHSVSLHLEVPADLNVLKRFSECRDLFLTLMWGEHKELQLTFDLIHSLLPQLTSFAIYFSGTAVEPYSDKICDRSSAAVSAYQALEELVHRELPRFKNLTGFGIIHHCFADASKQESMLKRCITWRPALQHCFFYSAWSRIVAASLYIQAANAPIGKAGRYTVVNGDVRGNGLSWIEEVFD
ncbi:hypothetical protein C8J56DRAFT_1059785 [Mycena floridula]|nr:hypothetical protein C8J56DRAFT_1059785 [Mycena floridula]